MEDVAFLILGVLILLRCMRIYERTRLNGELVKAAGISIVILSLSFKGVILPIIGFVIFNVGLLMAATFEYAFRKEVFGQLTFKERIIGDVPRIRYRKYSLDNKYNYSRTMGILTAIVCILLGLFFYKRLTKYEMTDLIFPALLLFAGIYFLVFFVLQKTRK